MAHKRKQNEMFSSKNQLRKISPSDGGRAIGLSSDAIAKGAGYSPFDREHQRRSKREAVLSAAASAFNRRGFANTSMDDVAEVLGVSKPTLYRYFSSKQQILYECHQGAMNHGEAALELASRSGQSGLEKFLIFTRRYMQGIFGDFGTCPVLTDVDSLADGDRERVVERRARISLATSKLIEEGIEDGSIAACDAKLASLFALGVVNWTPLWYRANGRKSPAEIMDEFLFLFRRTFSALEATPPSVLVPIEEEPEPPL